jgi:hypothetical protein
VAVKLQAPPPCWSVQHCRVGHAVRPDTCNKSILSLPKHTRFLLASNQWRSQVLVQHSQAGGPSNRQGLTRKRHTPAI